VGVPTDAPRSAAAAHAEVVFEDVECPAILDDGDQAYKGKIRPEQYHGSVYDVIPARTGYRKPLGEWNEEEIVADGRHIKVTLNGVIILDADLGIVKEPKVLARHPGLTRPAGHIGFLGHGTLVEFRNIRVKELP
jgi:hypothetical protein